MLQPLYLQYPEAQESYAQAGKEYLYGKDVLVAPVTSGGSTATTSVWFPAGDTWTDWFTGKTYEGGTTADVTTDLTTMPVFVRSGGIVPTRSHHVANDAAPLDAVTVTVATGADGSFALHEDSGEGQPTAAADTSARAAGNSASTAMRFTQQATGGTLDISPRRRLVRRSGAGPLLDGDVHERRASAVGHDRRSPRRRVRVDVRRRQPHPHGAGRRALGDGPDRRAVLDARGRGAEPPGRGPARHRR
ncbi:hypothetical protein [Curtobacterium sp. MCJR17_043]|uniref:DUF5110 domain-containing protein n=1 Tax=Curtobacterium sp. MCJR17_043 TaxID=2175660 RepID=UPI0032E90EA6